MATPSTLLGSHKRKTSPCEDGEQMVAPPSSKRFRSFETGIDDVGTDMFCVAEDTGPNSTPDSNFSAVFSQDEAISLAETATTSRGCSKRLKRFHCKVPACNKAFDRPVRLEMHMRSHTGERPYVCEAPSCGKTFLRNEHLKRHVDEKHSDDRKYVCEYVVNREDDGSPIHCGKSFTTATRLRRHVAAHEAKEETKCNEAGCGKVFRKQETLQRHIKTEHFGEKPYQCTHLGMSVDGQPVECGASFSKQSQLNNHEAREHSGMRYFCEICSPDGPQDHSTLDFDDLDSDLQPPIGFATYSDLQHHIRTIHPPTCTECGKQCESNRALKAHIDIEHVSLSDRQTHACPWSGCTRAFTKSGNLKVHIQNVHVKARNFVCGSYDLSGNLKVEGWNHIGCGSAFGTKASLEDHVRTQHLGLAGKFRPSQQRKKDEQGSETPASVNEPTTPMEIDRTVSMLTGHGYDQLKPMACLVADCQLRFVREYNLAEHLELVHGWHIDDVTDCLVERRTAETGQFWVGADAEESRNHSGRTKDGMAIDRTLEDEPFRFDAEEQLKIALAQKHDDGDDVVLDPALYTM